MVAWEANVFKTCWQELMEELGRTTEDDSPDQQLLYCGAKFGSMDFNDLVTMKMATRLTKKMQKRLVEIGSTRRVEFNMANKHGPNATTGDILNNEGYPQPQADTGAPGSKGETKEEAELRELRQKRETEERERTGSRENNWKRQRQTERE